LLQIALTYRQQVVRLTTFIVLKNIRLQQCFSVGNPTVL